MPKSTSVSNASITQDHKLLRKENASVLALPLNIMLVACNEICRLLLVRLGKGFLLYGNIISEVEQIVLCLVH